MAAVALYDLRSTTGAVRKIRAVTNQRQPVHSICHTAEDELFCATMGGVWAWGGGTKGAGASGQGEGREEALAEQLQIQVIREALSEKTASLVCVFSWERNTLLKLRSLSHGRALTHFGVVRPNLSFCTGWGLLLPLSIPRRGQRARPPPTPFSCFYPGRVSKACRLQPRATVATATKRDQVRKS